MLVMFRRDASTIVVFIELKSRRGVGSEVQKQIRLEMLPTGAKWRMALRAAARKRWRERQRAQEAATLAAERDDAVVCAQRWTAID